MKTLFTLSLTILFLTSCGMEKSADRMADNTEQLNKTTEVATEQVKQMRATMELMKDFMGVIKNSFTVMVSQFEVLNGNLEVIKDFKPLINKFDAFLDEDENKKKIVEDPFDFEDEELETNFDKLRKLELQYDSLNPSDPEHKKAIEKVNKALEQSLILIESSLKEVK